MTDTPEPFAAAVSLGRDWQSVADAVGAQLAGAPGRLGILYTAEHLAPHLEEMAAALERRTGVTDWVSAAGYGVIASGVEHFGEPGRRRARDGRFRRGIPPLCRRARSWRGARGARPRLARSGRHAARARPCRPAPSGRDGGGGRSRGRHGRLPRGGLDGGGGRGAASGRAAPPVV